MKKPLVKLFLSIICSILVFSWSVDKKFYGFEYEDAFINSYISSQPDYIKHIKNFRTEGCNKYVNESCIETTSFTGHYFPYSLYLSTIKKTFGIQNFQIHKLGNFILLTLGFFLIQLLFIKISLKEIVFLFSIISCLPFIYVFNSSLIENLSFFLGLLIIGIIYFTKDKNINLKSFIIFLIAVIALIKRENLIYLFLIPFFITLNDLKNYRLYFPLIFIITTQLILNPFFTELLEAEHIKVSTFSLNYLLFQLPVYLLSLISLKGFLAFTLVVFVLAIPTKKSFYFLGLFFSFILLYSLHYRSQFAIIEKNISLFDTYRYLVNSMPFLIGYFLYSRKRKKNILIYLPLGIFVLFSFVNSIKTFGYFVEDENYNYHEVNDKINSIKQDNSNIVVFDNFNLISLLNSANSINILELSYENIDNLIHIESDINFKDGVFIINRFNYTDMSEIKNNFQVQKIDSLSTKTSIVYKLFIKNL